ncbi:S8 family serine peptidase [Streptomyces sp. NPDC001843]|uniref:S8 family serine peptidase n=1 Tax=Streptomyces sp. NPDC001843 TaxID=3364617 RepID=UPI0036C0F4E8
MRRAPSPATLFTVPLTSVFPAVFLAAFLTVFLLGIPPAAASVPLPTMPVRLGTKESCTAASTRTATAASWAQQSLGLPRAWQLTQGAGVTVGVVDTGVTPGAAALSGRVTAVGAAGDDCVGHGSFVAGLVAAGPTGSTAFEGVAPRARVLAVRGTDTRGTATAGLVADGIRTAVDHGAQVVLVSAALSDGEDELTAAVGYATRHDTLVVAPAAPDVTSWSESAAPTRYWPAAAPGALSVVGVTANGTPLQSAKGVTGAALTAPGGGIVSIGARGTGHYLSAGSSLAAALTAGTAALVRSYHPDLKAAQVAERLTVSAAPAALAPRLDPYSAVSMVPGSGPAARAAAPGAVRIALPSDRPRQRAAWAAAGALLLVLVVAAALVVTPRGRARGWRP